MSGVLSRRLGIVILIVGIPLCAARADRSLRQQDPAYMYQKKGKYTEAALYWHRAMQGVGEVWIPVLWGDVSNAPGKWRTEYPKLVPAYRARYEQCLDLGKVTSAQKTRIAFINNLWLDELITQEEGGFRLASGRRAEEAEKQGDFILGEVLRRYQARLFRLGAAPFHRRAAAWCEAAGRNGEAALHRRAVTQYEEKAALAERLAKGDAVLAGMPFWGKRRRQTGINVGHANSIVIRDAYHRRVFSAVGNRHGKMSAAEVAAALKAHGLKHADENVRLSSVTVLRDLGETDALIAALSDRAAVVRRLAADMLVETRSAEGWAACARHPDASVRALLASRLAPVDGDLRLQTGEIVELIRGLNATSATTRRFCQDTLERVTGKKLSTAAWPRWWKTLGNARPGLTRRGPGEPAALDETVDFGAWWQSGFASIRHRPNPLTTYALPAEIAWRGYLLVEKSGNYRFTVRNRGEGIGSDRRVHTPGRWGFPAYFPRMAVKLTVDGKMLLPAADADVAEDPSAWMRIDVTAPVRLERGLREIVLTFSIRSYDDMKTASNRSIWGGTPCIRLYWSSDHFLRHLIDADHLLTMEAPALQ